MIVINRECDHDQ